MKNRFSLYNSLGLLMSLLIAALVAPCKWIHRQFTLWRLQPARKSLLDAYGHGQLTSNLLHKLDADILRRGGFSYLLLLLFTVGLLYAPRASAQTSSLDLVGMTNATPIIAYGVTSNTFTLTRDCDLAIDARLFTTNSSVAAALAGSFSIDTTNFGLSPFTLSGVATSNGIPGLTSLTSSNSIAVPTFWTNFNHSVIAGFTSVRLYLTNSAATDTTTNLFGTLILNRPTINTATY